MSDSTAAGSAVRQGWFAGSLSVARLTLMANPQNKCNILRPRVSVERDIASTAARNDKFSNFRVDLASNQWMPFER